MGLSQIVGSDDKKAPYVFLFPRPAWTGGGGGGGKPGDTYSHNGTSKPSHF